MESAQGVYTIPLTDSFVDTLAAGIMARYGDNLSAVTLLLPNRRSCLHVRDAFLRLSDGKPLLMPRMSPVGDVEEESLFFAAMAAEKGNAITAIPPAISPLLRQILLCRQVQAWHHARGEYVSAEQAMTLGKSLATFLDEVQREQCEFDSLTALVPEEYASHWQQTLAFLMILTEYWPAVLAEYGVLDPVERRNRMMQLLTEYWEVHPPQQPVIAAGTTGSVPSTAALLKVITQLPQGAVVLPGLDLECDDEYWSAIPPSHPQFGMHQLLGHLEVTRDEVQPWQKSDIASMHNKRNRQPLLREVMRPAVLTSGWCALNAHNTEKTTPFDISGMVRIDTSHQQEEAAVIALLLRDTLHVSGKTAALITPDRGLARRVTAEMQRYGVTVDDSAGMPLAQTPAAVMLRLVVEMAVSDAASVPLLSLLKHPLCFAGVESAECRAWARKLEVEHLRGVRIEGGLPALLHLVRDNAALHDWLEELNRHCRPFIALCKQKDVTVANLLEAHIGCAEWLAGGADRLWRGEAGQSLAAYLSQLRDMSGLMASMRPVEYGHMLESLLGQETFRHRYGLHPRVHILSPMEARLVNYDRVILGGLNEEGWPKGNEADPWMSRPMRQAFGLPAVDEAIGMSAHDFASLFHASEVFLTRANKVDGAPTVPSRWLLRLDAVLDAVGGKDAAKRWRHEGEIWRYWAALLDRPMEMDESHNVDLHPYPTPPVEARPRQLSVTAIETLIRDPYAVYARHILKLKPLKPLEEDPGAADFGSIIHAALEHYCKSYAQIQPNHRLEVLLSLGKECFAELSDRPTVKMFWWPRFERIAAWFVEADAARRQRNNQIHAEISGRRLFALPAGEFMLTAKADRIELGDAPTILDYKTGKPPSEKEVTEGLSPQLVLEALILASGGFDELPAADVAELYYWQLKGGTGLAGKEEPRAVKALEQIVDETAVGVEALLAAYDDGQMPYLACPDARIKPKYNDYDHLERRAEWG